MHYPFTATVEATEEQRTATGLARLQVHMYCYPGCAPSWDDPGDDPEVEMRYVSDGKRRVYVDVTDEQWAEVREEGLRFLKEDC